MTIVDAKLMAEWLRLTEEEFLALGAEGLPTEPVEIILGVEVHRYESAKVIEWWIARRVRQRLAH